jgi:hypothetical protein
MAISRCGLEPNACSLEYGDQIEHLTRKLLKIWQSAAMGWHPMHVARNMEIKLTT